MAGGGRGRERPCASRPASPPPDPQPRLLRLGRTRRLWARPPLGSAATPSAARSRPAPPHSARRSVRQSVSHGADGAGAAGARGVSGQGAPHPRRRRRPKERERRLPSPGPPEDRAAAAVSAQPRPRGRRREPARRGAVRRCRPCRLHFSAVGPRHPGAVRAAEPGAGSLPGGRCGRARSREAGGRPARGGRRAWLHPAPLGAARREILRCGTSWGGCGWPGGPGPRGAKAFPRLPAETSEWMSGVPWVSVPSVFHKCIQCRGLERHPAFCAFFLIKQAK